MSESSIVERKVDVPTDALNQRMKLATQFYKAGCFGSDVRNPEQAFVKIMAGAEMGMGAMEAMNSLYIVNGKITIWGAALSRRLRDKGWKITYEEKGVESCTATIKKDDETYSYEATAKEIVALGSTAFKKAPKDKLKWHALSRIVRFYVPEVLGGSVSYVQEELVDVAKTNKTTAEDVISDIKSAKDEKELEQIEFNLAKFVGEFPKESLDEIAKTLKSKKESFKKCSEEDRQRNSSSKSSSTTSKTTDLRASSKSKTQSSAG